MDILITDTMKDMLVGFARRKGSASRAGMALGVNPSTYTRWLKPGAKIDDARWREVEDAIDDGGDILEKAITSSRIQNSVHRLNSLDEDILAYYHAPENRKQLARLIESIEEWKHPTPISSTGGGDEGTQPESEATAAAG